MSGNGHGLDGIDTWIFDLDNTLYPARHRLIDQVSRRMTDYVADFLGLDRDEARAVQKAYFRDHGTTLRGMMTHHGCRPEEFLAYVHDIDYSTIPEDPGLAQALGRLPGRKFVFTNGDLPHAERTMARLGIADRIEAVFDIVAADYIPKPHPAGYQSMVDLHGIEPVRAVYFEDIARNLRPAKDLGMTTVWIEGDGIGNETAAIDDHIDHRATELTPWLTRLVAPAAG